MRLMDAEGLILKRVERFWAERAIDMVRHACGMYDCQRQTMSLEDLRVSKGWPTRGSIKFTREDGVRVTCALRGGKWTVQYTKEAV